MLLFVSLIASGYPSFVMGKLKTVEILKGKISLKKPGIFRNALIVAQFVIAIVLICTTVIIYQQFLHLRNAPLGYSTESLITVPIKKYESGKEIVEKIRTLLASQSSVVSVSGSDVNFGLGLDGSTSQTSFGFDYNGKSVSTDFMEVNYDILKTLNIPVKEGRDFSRAFSRDSLSIVINEAAVKFMGLKNPVGKTIRWGDDKDGKDYTVIGVIKDMLMQSPYKPVLQSFYFLDYQNVYWINLKLNPNKSASESIAKINSIFKKHISSAPFEYKFADEEFAAKFKTEEQIGELALFFAILAIFISCLGLFGLASFVAEQRTKEIGIRKVLGATVMNLWTLLSKDFVFLVIISVLIATPIAYFFMNNWLQKYDYRTNISWWVFALSGLGVMMITLLTVSYQAIKAAVANPVKSLRTE